MYVPKSFRMQQYNIIANANAKDCDYLETVTIWWLYLSGDCDYLVIIWYLNILWLVFFVTKILINVSVW